MIKSGTYNLSKMETDELDNKGKKSLNAAIWYLISSFVSKGLIYALTPLYTRLLSTYQYGEYNNFLSWQSILVVILGVDLYATVSIAYYDFKNDSEFNAYIKSITLASYIIPSFFCLFIFGRSDFFSDLFSIEKKYLWLLCVYIAFNNTINIFQAEQRIKLKYKLSVFITLLTAVLNVILTCIFVIFMKDTLLGILLGGIVVNAIVGIGLAFGIFQKGNKIKLEYLKYALCIAIPLLPHVLATSVLGSSDKVMISKYCGKEETGLYGLVYTISMVITMISSSINKAWTPWFFEQMKVRGYSKIRSVSKILVILIGVISIGICLAAPEIVLIVGGKEYESAKYLFPPLIGSCVINGITDFYVNIEFYLKKTGYTSIVTVMMTLINLVLNYFGITRFGYIAAAYTSLLSSIIGYILHLYVIRKEEMWHVFDNGLILGWSSVCVVLLLFVRLSYASSIIRYLILLSYVIFLVCVLLIKYYQYDILKKTK